MIGTKKRIVFGIIALTLFAALSCLSLIGCPGGDNGVDLPPFEEKTITPEGGTYQFENGIVMDIPEGAVSDATSIRVRQLLNSEVDPLLADKERLIKKRMLGGFVAEPDGLVFNQPIRVSFPISSLMNPGGIPFHAYVNPAIGLYYLAPTYLTYDPSAGMVEMEIESFSGHSAVELEMQRAATECQNPDTACRCARIYVESGASDFSSGDCQVVTDTVRVTFLDCPGQPTEESTMSDTTPECDEEEDNEDIFEKEEWSGTLILNLSHEMANPFSGIKSFNDTMTYNFNFTVDAEYGRIKVRGTGSATQNISIEIISYYEEELGGCTKTISCSSLEIYDTDCVAEVGGSLDTVDDQFLLYPFNDLFDPLTPCPQINFSYSCTLCYCGDCYDGYCSDEVFTGGTFCYKYELVLLMIISNEFGPFQCPHKDGVYNGSGSIPDSTELGPFDDYTYTLTIKKEQ